MSRPGRPDLSHGLVAGMWARNRALVTIAEALRKHKGNASLAADELGVDRRTMRRWLARWPALREARHKAYAAAARASSS